MKYLSVAALFPSAVAVGYSERFWPYLAAGAIAAGGGLGARARHARQGARRHPRGLSRRLAHVDRRGRLRRAAVSLLRRSAAEHARSTRTSRRCPASRRPGRSIVAAPEELPRSLLMWRQFTQWLGGMGIIVLALAVLPRLRVGGRQLFESELPGPELEPLATSIRDTAQRLWLLYIALTGVLVLTLSIFAWTGADDAMSVYDAVGHAFATLPTGGFGVRGTVDGGVRRGLSMGHCAVHAPRRRELRPALRAFVRGDGRAAARDDEFRLYLALLAVRLGDPAARAPESRTSRAARGRSATPSSRPCRS